MRGSYLQLIWGFLRRNFFSRRTVTIIRFCYDNRFGKLSMNSLRVFRALIIVSVTSDDSSILVSIASILILSSIWSSNVESVLDLASGNS